MDPGPEIPYKKISKKSPYRAGVFKIKEIVIVEFSVKISGENRIDEEINTGITVISVIYNGSNTDFTLFW